mmetsp:Transcript_15073/g.23314  ORF Transcript_15073/g.23314 Transcript_15073/m.23314 type:complete len:119 (-) Transcript_15073:33-389(-)
MASKQADPPKSETAPALNQRPQRKAKTKEAVMKHLNRDVDLLVEKPSTKKSASKKAVVPLPSKKSASKSSVGKATVARAQDSAKLSTLPHHSLGSSTQMTKQNSVSPKLPGLPHEEKG